MTCPNCVHLGTKILDAANEAFGKLADDQGLIFCHGNELYNAMSDVIDNAKAESEVRDEKPL